MRLLGCEHSPELMLLAARALTFLADVSPTAGGAIVRHGAVPALCNRLLGIEYIDLAEQSLSALEKLSGEYAGALLRAGALVAVLSYVDFFPTGVQRVAVATAANVASALRGEPPAQHADAVAAAVPVLVGLLEYEVSRSLRASFAFCPGHFAAPAPCCASPPDVLRCAFVALICAAILGHAPACGPARALRLPPPRLTLPTPAPLPQDAKIVNSACLALTRIAAAAARRAPQMEALCALGLVQSAMRMASPPACL